MTMRRAVVIVASVVLAGGCGFLSKSKSRFYSLERIAPPQGVVANIGGVPIGIDVVELPPGLDRRDIVVRQKDHELDVRGTEQWQASLEPMVLHTLAFDLASRLPEGMVILPGQVKPVTMRGIDVVIGELAAGPEQQLVLDARWIVREAGRTELTRQERITIELASLKSADVANGMSQAIAELANRMVVQLAGR